jgi:hypothetical protein
LNPPARAGRQLYNTGGGPIYNHYVRAASGGAHVVSLTGVRAALPRPRARCYDDNGSLPRFGGGFMRMLRR